MKSAKSVFKLFGFIALVAVIGFSIAGCDNGNGPGGDPGPQTLTYRGTGDDGSEYTLKITGDNYELTVTPTSGPPKTSSGTVTKNGTEFTLTPSGADPEDAFTISVNTTGGITEIEGTITFTDGETQEAPEEITPPVVGGTLMVTGIPSQYNGKYAVFISDGFFTQGLALAGCQSIDMEAQTFTFVQITNGSVSLPMWTVNDSGQLVRYSGNDTNGGTIGIFNQATSDLETVVTTRYYDSITFSNGSATRTWASGGNLTITGIPSEYNGKYAGFSGGSNDVDLMGCQSINMGAQTFTFVQITNGSVNLPMWTFGYNDQLVGYFGNDTVEGGLVIANSATFNPETTQPLAIRYWDSIQFSNGGATRTWDSGTDMPDW